MLSDMFDHFGDSDRGGLGPGGGENVYAERAPITDLPQPELGCARQMRHTRNAPAFLRFCPHYHDADLRFLAGRCLSWCAS